MAIGTSAWKCENTGFGKQMHPLLEKMEVSLISHMKKIVIAVGQQQAAVQTGTNHYSWRKFWHKSGGIYFRKPPLSFLWLHVEYSGPMKLQITDKSNHLKCPLKLQQVDHCPASKNLFITLYLQVLCPICF